MGLFPGREAGAELAAIFAVFTAQAWNMAFSFYQSLRAVPQDMRDVSGQFCLNGWQTFWRLEVPFAIPGLTWNTMMSMSGSWFFIVAAEAISVGNTQINLPGIGSWLGLAISKMDLQAVGLAILTMAVVILAYDQLIFRPIVAWSDKFNMGQTARQIQPRSWVYDILRRTKVLGVMMRPLRALGYKILCIRWSNDTHKHHAVSFVAPVWAEKSFDTIWYIVLGAFVAGCVFYVMHYLQATLTIANVTVVIVLGLITLLRVMLMVLLASLIWVPIGVWVGLRPRMVAWVQPLALFLSAFPANILFPLVVIVIVYFNLNPDIWLSPLIVLGTQWYIFFNVIAGVSAYPNDLQEAAQIYQVRSWLWWRRVMLPGVLPYYVTGAITAAGGSWNASIVAEVVSWGSIKLQAHGLGAYIADATAAGNFHKVVLGVTVMSVFVVCINRAVWRRLHDYAARLAGMEA
ncbi:MAG TPA: ABC transporter permease subunit, partial [Gammaproteobacteria bacterium]|nr:ABC transporter permease subunit [Gammaproteobacteria bacterium]